MVKDLCENGIQIAFVVDVFILGWASGVIA